MNWLLLLAMTITSTFGFILGWALCRSFARREAQAARIRASLERVANTPVNHAVWRSRR
ncbi:MAG: hypothetical protein M3133_05200 [Actinomycetota bacterium]|nr:hypothetical protein [Actinomycetota bacterium]